MGCKTIHGGERTSDVWNKFFKMIVLLIVETHYAGELKLLVEVRTFDLLTWTNFIRIFTKGNNSPMSWVSVLVSTSVSFNKNVGKHDMAKR